jgi:hypothetical protein
MLRLIDLLAVLAVAVVLLLPRASVDARPALAGEPLELDRVARLQDDVFREPDNAEALLGLGDALLSFGRPDWAVTALSRFTRAAARDEPWTRDPLARARIHLTLATARAERLEAAEAVAEAHAAEQSCASGSPGCAPLLSRSALIRGAMQALLDAKVDPAQDPQRAKEAVYRALHPSRPAYR